MKKKIITLALLGVLAVTAVVGASLAYFTDSESEEIGFTVGEVDVELETNADGSNRSNIQAFDLFDAQTTVAVDSDATIVE